MSDAEVKDLNQISKKDIYHTPSGKYIQFIHDHSEKTFDAWELLPDGSHRLLESQSTTIETFDEFNHFFRYNSLKPVIWYIIRINFADHFSEYIQTVRLFYLNRRVFAV